MKTIKKITENWKSQLRERCDKLNPKERKRLILIGIIVYVFLTIASIAWTVMDSRSGKMKIEHIEQNKLPSTN